MEGGGVVGSGYVVFMNQRIFPLTLCHEYLSDLDLFFPLFFRGHSNRQGGSCIQRPWHSNSGWLHAKERGHGEEGFTQSECENFQVSGCSLGQVCQKDCEGEYRNWS